jgi:hypothetical protein
MQPDLATFLEHARQGNVVPVAKAVMADLETPVSAYLKVAGEARNSFLLEIWTGMPPPRLAMEAAAREALGAKTHAA